MQADFIKTAFWLDHGADGFRVDVAHGLCRISTARISMIGALLRRVAG